MCAYSLPRAPSRPPSRVLLLPSRRLRYAPRVVCRLPGSRAPARLWLRLTPPPGFDPLGLGIDPDRLKWYVEAELQNGRWAMMAVAGILATDALGLPVWYEAGAQDYWLPPLPQLAVLAPVMGFLETKRLEGFLKTGQSGLVDMVPFDPMGMGKSADMKVKEIKNGASASGQSPPCFAQR